MIKQKYEPEIRSKIEDIFTKIIEYTYSGTGDERQANTNKIPSIDE